MRLVSKGGPTAAKYHHITIIGLNVYELKERLFFRQQEQQHLSGTLNYLGGKPVSLLCHPSPRYSLTARGFEF